MTLPIEVEKVVQSCINEVITSYTANTKVFTADTLHKLRCEITSKVHEKVGKDKVISVDVGLDLSALQDFNFCFKVNIPSVEGSNAALQS